MSHINVVYIAPTSHCAANSAQLNRMSRDKWKQHRRSVDIWQTERIGLRGGGALVELSQEFGAIEIPRQLLHAPVAEAQNPDRPFKKSPERQTINQALPRAPSL